LGGLAFQLILSSDILTGMIYSGISIGIFIFIIGFFWLILYCTNSDSPLSKLFQKYFTENEYHLHKFQFSLSYSNVELTPNDDFQNNPYGYANPTCINPITAKNNLTRQNLAMEPESNRTLEDKARTEIVDSVGLFNKLSAYVKTNEQIHCEIDRLAGFAEMLTSQPNQSPGIDTGITNSGQLKIRPSEPVRIQSNQKMPMIQNKLLAVSGKGPSKFLNSNPTQQDRIKTIDEYKPQYEGRQFSEGEEVPVHKFNGPYYQNSVSSNNKSSIVGLMNRQSDKEIGAASVGINVLPMNKKPENIQNPLGGQHVQYGSPKTPEVHIGNMYSTRKMKHHYY